MFDIEILKGNIDYMSYKDLCSLMNISMYRLKKEIQNHNIIDDRLYRICKGCNRKVYHKNVKNRIRQENNNKLCVKCWGLIKEDMYKGEGNPFYGKTHSEETINYYKRIHKGKRYSKRTEFKKGQVIEDKKSVYYYWKIKYGKEEADKRSKEWRNKLSIANSGSNNPMYGKPSPIGSGNGWSGWYKSWYFRSLLELSYMIYVIERFKIPWEKAESKNYKIEYEFNGVKKNYYADFILDNKYLIECKPKRLWKSEINKSKFSYAKKYCENNGLIFKVIDCYKIQLNELIELYLNGDISFVTKYEEKIKSIIN